jgi:GAF domain-containing protein
LPLLREGECIGLLGIAGKRAGIFSENEIALAESFRDQALIAIENTRLFNETREALEQQRASADILNVISNSVADTQPVFDKILDSIEHLFDSEERVIFLSGDDGLLHIGAIRGPNADVGRTLFPAPLEGTASEMAIRDRRMVRTADIFHDPDIPEAARERSRRFGKNYSMVVAPMLQDDRAIGTIMVMRTSMEAFTDRECDLLRTFADQAVIAIQNARLFNETREALERQTATADILKVIASSPSDVQPVFEAIATSANKLIGGVSTAVMRFAGDTLQLAAFTPTNAKADAALQAAFPQPLAEFPPFMLVRDGETVQFTDTESEDVPPVNRELARLRGYRSMLFTPLMSEGSPIGIISVTRAESGAFPAHHVQLVQTFADQAVIAIENVRLFEEVQAKTRDLTEALQQQTATSEVLKVISSSPGELEPVFNSMLQNAVSICDAKFGNLFLIEGDSARWEAGVGTPPKLAQYFTQSKLFRPTPGSHLDRVMRIKQVSHTADDAAEAVVGAAARLGGARSTICVPMVKDEALVGAIFIYRTEVRPFTDTQIDLVKNFAAQAVIAIENTRLLNELRQRTDDLSESLQQQTATADVLEVISRSAFDLNPVFETVAESSVKLCGSDRALIFRFDGELLQVAAAFNAPHHLRDWLEQNPIRPGRHSVAARAALERRTIQVQDVFADPEHTYGAKDIEPFRTVLGVPMLKGDDLLGVILVYHNEVRQFTDKQIALVETFADQAVIAIENVRLFDEVQARTRDLTEALTYQTAISNVLNVISRSPSDIQPVLDTIAETAQHLCQSEHAYIFRLDGDKYHLAAARDVRAARIEFLRDNPIAPNRGSTVGRVALERRPIHIMDALADSEYKLSMVGHGGRTILGVPLLRDGVAIGVIVLTRGIVRPFVERQIELVSTFADQALIAIENVRLFDEVQARTNDLSESLQQQTATADVLKVISRSAFDLQTVLDTLVESAARLCEADMVVITRQKDDKYFRAGSYGFTPEFMDYVKDIPIKPERGTITGRTLLEGQVVHVPDVHADPDYTFSEAQKLSGDPRTFLGVPLLREGNPVGALVLLRRTMRPFTDKQIELVTTFADQAVIAIENVRLFDEVQARTRDLSEALTYQTGSGNILKVIASSPTDVGPVLKAIVESACELCDAVDAIVLLNDGDSLRSSAHHGPIPLDMERWPISRNWVAGRAFLDRKPVHVHDLLAAEGDEFPDTRQRTARTGTRSILSVPLLREGRSIGTIVLRRTEVHPFSDKQIALLQTFADQAVIAIGNVRLFEEVQARTEDLHESLQFQTATSDVLKVISSSPDSLQPVLDVIVDTSRNLCGTETSTIFLLRDERFHIAAASGAMPEYLEFLRTNPIALDQPGSSTSRAAREKRTVHIPDIGADPEFGQGPMSVGQRRALLSVPLMREGTAIGVITMRQSHLTPFTERQIEVVQTFADQAVIAISNVRLFEQVQQRTRELSQSLDDLRTAQDRLVQTEKLASLGQLTAGIAHEIKNPLNFVNNFSALSAELVDELNDALKPAALEGKTRHEVDDLTQLLKDNLQKVVQHGKRADSIVKNMLLHSREGSGEHRPTDINALLDESLNLAYHGARAEKSEFNITLQRDFDEMAGMIELFPQEITRAFLNLISNGFYAATKRKAEIGNSGFEPALSATTRNRDSSVEIRIRDNGTGIPAEVKEKMFNPFFTTKPAGEGTGLGLSMSHDIIVKQHGGTIDVATEPGQFTEFTIVLPRISNPHEKKRDRN